MGKFDKEAYLKWYEDMLFWRKFEDKLATVYIQRGVRGFLHLYNGQEAVAAGCLYAIDPTEDKMITSYRYHIHPTGLGADPRRIMAELYGKGTGTLSGLEGSVHIFSEEHHFYDGHDIVGGQIALGAGSAFADKFLNRDGVTLTFMGDGAMHQGAFHEALNLVMSWKLSVVFIVENNHYVMGTSVERAANHVDIWKLGLGYEMPCQTVDGTHPETVTEAVYEATERARGGDGPTLLDIRTYRYKGHSMSDAQHYCIKEEMEEYEKQDPVTNVLGVTEDKKYVTDAELEAIGERVKNLVAECKESVEELSYPEHHIMHGIAYDQEDYPFLRDGL